MKISEIFERDIKRKFSDITIVDDQIKASDINEYVMTENIEDIFGCFLAYFFDSDKFPKCAPKARIVKKNYSNEIGPGVWLSGPFGTGKSQLLIIIYILFTIGSIDYSDAKGNKQRLDIISTIKEKIRKKEVADLLDNIKSFEYTTLIYSPDQLKASGDTIIDYLPKAVAKELFLAVNKEKKYSVPEAAEFLNNAILNPGKKRMIIFIDDILDALDTEDKVRDFNDLLELLNNDIWFVVASTEGKEKIDSNAGKVIIEKFGQEQILLAKDMADIVKQRYLAKNEEGKAEIEKTVNLSSLQELSTGTALSGSFDIRNVVECYPFSPCQIAYMTELLGKPSEFSEINLMKVIKSIVTNLLVHDNVLGHFVDIELIYEQLQSKLDEFSKLIHGLENEPINTPLEKNLLLRSLKTVILLAQVKSAALKASDVLPLVYSEDGISNEQKLQAALAFLASVNLISDVGGLYVVNANYPEKADLPVLEEPAKGVIESQPIEVKQAASTAETAKEAEKAIIADSAAVVEEPNEVTEAEEQSKAAVSEQEAVVAVNAKSEPVKEAITEDSAAVVIEEPAEVTEPEKQNEPVVFAHEGVVAVSLESEPVKEAIIEDSPAVVVEEIVEVTEPEKQSEPAVSEHEEVVAVSAESEPVKEAITEDTVAVVIEEPAEATESEKQSEPAVSEHEEVVVVSAESEPVKGAIIEESAAVVIEEPAEATESEKQGEPAVSEHEEVVAASVKSEPVKEAITEESAAVVIEEPAEATAPEKQSEPAVFEQQEVVAVNVEESEPAKSDEKKLQEALAILASANLISNVDGLYVINANRPEKADLPVVDEPAKDVIESQPMEVTEAEEQSKSAVSVQEEAPAGVESEAVKEAIIEDRAAVVVEEPVEVTKVEEQSELAVSKEEEAAVRVESEPVKEAITVGSAAVVIEEPAEVTEWEKQTEPVNEKTSQQNFITEEKPAFSQPSKRKPIKRKYIKYQVLSQTAPALNDSSQIVLNPKYVFETFVVGNCNRFAHAVSQAVANSPGQVYNPMFLYGGVGLGKTHLMHAIGHRIRQNHPKLKVVYISTEKFINELIDSLRDGKTESFRQKYRNIDVLMVDDIQFLSKQEHAQEEFFHTFNTLHEANKQIIISSDRSPREIHTLEDRLRSRFQMGLITDIQSPDIETRIAILRKKAITEKFAVPNDVMFYIASHIDTNIRELEGALNRVMAYASMTSQTLDIKLAREVLKAILPSGGPEPITKEPKEKAASSDAKTSGVNALELCLNHFDSI